MDKAYDVYLHHSMKRIGWQAGSEWGGVVSDGDGNSVGIILVNPETRIYYLKADQPWHTGKQWDGERVSVDNRPSKDF